VEPLEKGLGENTFQEDENRLKDISLAIFRVPRSPMRRHRSFVVVAPRAGLDREQNTRGNKRSNSSV
jgi:hypothetical protein